MKRITLILAILVFSMTSFAASTGTTPTKTPRTYFMMKHGKLIEVSKGNTRLVKKDVTLVNESTIHPNGMIDVSSGEARQLLDGEYITLDGRIRKLKDMPRSSKAKR